MANGDYGWLWGVGAVVLLAGGGYVVYTYRDKLGLSEIIKLPDIKLPDIIPSPAPSPSPTPTPTPSPTTSGKEIYPTAGWTWTMNMSNPVDGNLNFGGGSNFSKLLNNPDGSWRANDDVDVKFNIIVNKGENGGKPDAIGGCAMSFPDSVNRGFAHAANDIGKKGIEMTGFFKVYGPLGHNSHDSIPGIFMKGPWSHHPGTAGECCQEVEYYHVLETNGTLHYVKEGSQNNIFPHPTTHKIPNFNMINAGWFGLKYIFINETTNKADPKVRLQSYFNRNGDGKTWEKISEIVDDANSKWGNPSARCGGKPYQVYAWANSGMVIKFYTSRVDFKDWSIREINPTSASANVAYLTEQQRPLYSSRITIS